MANPTAKDRTGRYSVAVFENEGHQNVQVQIGYVKKENKALDDKDPKKWSHKDISFDVKDWDKVKTLVETTLAKLK